MALVGGVDGCPGGWLLARTTYEPTRVDVSVHARFDELLASNADLEVVAVDIPIGLTLQGPRPTDTAARALLGPRRSSVFPAPVRAALGAETYPTACELSLAAHGKKLSKQAFALLPKIREVDQVLGGDASAARRVREIHPEVSFCVWNGDQPMAHPKRSSLGFRERLRLVESRFAGAFETARRKLRRGSAADDDILDALAALWTADRIRSGTARCVPAGEQELDSLGIPMNIWA
jgi:predicted RNase H-like nuclease